MTQPFRRRADPVKTTARLQLVHSDVCGPMSVRSPGGCRYIVTFLDDWSRCAKIFLLREKSEVLRAFQEFKAAAELATGEKLCALRTDGGGEYVNAAFETYLKTNGVEWQRSAPYCPQQNGAAERLNRTLVEMGRSMLCHANRPTGWWAEAVSTAVYLYNRVTSSATSETPFKRWYGRDDDLRHLRVWGCIGHALLPSAQRTKFGSKTEVVRLLGYELGIKAYRVQNVHTGRIYVRRDVVFEEDRFVVRSNGKKGTNNQEEKKSPLAYWEVALEESQDGEDEDASADNLHEDNTQADEDGNDEQGGDDSEEEDNLQQDRPPRRSERTRQPPVRFGYDEYVDMAEEVALLAIGDEPCNYKQAMQSADAQTWRTAAEEEHHALLENKTWDLVALPPDRKPVGCRWVFRVKRNEDGHIVRHKARLVAQGFTQRASVDYEETFAPVARWETIRLLIAFATLKNLHLHQMDVETAFLNGCLEEEVYMVQPEGFDDRSGRVCRLRKSLYGLKQSPRCWNQALHEYLLRVGYRQAEADPCVYSKGKDQLLAVYVDDLVLATKTEDQMAKMKNKLSDNFKMKDLGRLHHLLGVKVERADDGAILLSQKHYVDAILKRLDFEDCRPVGTPADPNVVLVANDGNSQPADSTSYQQLVGSLLYAAVVTRPDIAQAVSAVCRFTSAPTEAHWTAAKRILRYLKGTATYGLRYGPMGENDITNYGVTALVGFSDADWAGDRDSRKSTTGHCYLYAGAVVSWLSQRQPIVALSSTEAEYVALSSAAQQAVWLRCLLSDLWEKQTTPTRVYEDNQGAICLAKNPIHHKRTKHIDIKHHYIREKVSDKTIELAFLPTTEMVADLLTKPLHKPQFQRLRDKMGLYTSPDSR